MSQILRVIRRRFDEPSLLSLDSVINRFAINGSYWFSEGAMRFFRTRLPREIVGTLPNGCAVFVTSEQAPNHSRRYCVRIARPDAKMETVGFCRYRTA